MLTLLMRLFLLSLSTNALSVLQMSIKMTTIASKGSTIQVGLTGSIGMGKSSVASHFQALGIPVFDADNVVHELYSQGGDAVEPVRKIVPDAIVDNAVERKLLGQFVFNNPVLLKQLESIVHPLVVKKRREFYQQAVSEGHLLVVYDIPLLLENPQNHEVDYVMVVTASKESQRSRVLQRPGMTVEKFEAILSKQMPDADKRRLAHFVINTDYPEFSSARAQVAQAIEAIISGRPDDWQRYISRSNNPPLTKTLNRAMANSDSYILRASTATSVTEPKSIGDTHLRLTDHWDLAVFDLDDTLVPTWPALKSAGQAMLDRLAETAPKLRDVLNESPSSLPIEMKRLCEVQPLISHDHTEIRRSALVNIAKREGLEYDQSIIEDAIHIWRCARSKVGPHLYSDTLPCLQWLREQGLQVAVLTNGNADLTLDDDLKDHLTLSVSACDLGAAKPSPVPFLAILQRSGVCANRVLFIGDSHENDVAGAKKCGMHAVLLDRNDAGNSASILASDVAGLTSHTSFSNFRSDFVPPDIIVSSLEPSHFAEKLQDYVSARVKDNNC